MASSEKQLRLIRMSEVEEHINGDSCWIVLHNNVYDVTNFLEEHPGGGEAILEQAGKDATDPFEDVGHSADARDLLPEYLIGQVHPDDLEYVKNKNINEDDGNTEDTPWKSWLIPITIGLVVSLAYRYYLTSRYSGSSGGL